MYKLKISPYNKNGDIMKINTLFPYIYNRHHIKGISTDPTKCNKGYIFIPIYNKEATNDKRIKDLEVATKNGANIYISNKYLKESNILSIYVNNTETELNRILPILSEDNSIYQIIK